MELSKRKQFQVDNNAQDKFGKVDDTKQEGMDGEGELGSGGCGWHAGKR